MAEIASTRPPRGTGAMYLRVYGIAADGTRYEIPRTPPAPGKCPVEGCTCGGTTR